MRKYLLCAVPLMLLASSELAAAPLLAVPSMGTMPAARPPAIPAQPRADGQKATSADGQQPISQQYDNGRHHLKLYLDPNTQSGSVYARSDTDNTDLDVDVYGKAAQDEVKGWGDVETGVFTDGLESRGEVVHGVTATPPGGSSKSGKKSKPVSAK